MVSDAAVGVELIGYGISRTLAAGESTIEFTAPKLGNFSLVMSASQIAVAQITVSGAA